MRGKACAGWLLLALVSSPALAQGVRDPVVEAAALWSATWRSATVGTPASQISAAGVTPLTVGADAWVWPLRWLGARASYRVEGFGLGDSGARGVLHHGLLAAAARLRVSALRLEPFVGWAVDTLPAWTVDAAEQTVWSTAARHAVGVGLRAGVDLGRASLELTGLGQFGASGLGVDLRAAVLVRLLRTGALRWCLQLEAGFSEDRLRASSLEVDARSVRGSVGLAVRGGERDAVETPGELLLRVKLPEGVAPDSVVVRLLLKDSERPGALGPDGSLWFEGLPQGEATLVLAAPGCASERRAVTVRGGASAELEVALRREQATTGAISVAVVDRATRAPVVASVAWAQGSVTTDAQGRAQLASVEPGPQALVVSAPGYASAREVALVVAGSTAPMAIALEPAGKPTGILAGSVFSARDLKPLQASVLVNDVAAPVGADGRFEVPCAPGQYTLVVTAVGHERVSRTVSVGAGERVVVQVPLRRR